MGRKLNFTKSGIGLRGLRMMVGIPAHAPSAHALCVGAALKDTVHTPAGPGQGGKENVLFRNSFVAASKACGQSVPKVVR